MSIESRPCRVALSGATMGTRYSALFYAAKAEGHEPIGAALHAAVCDVDAVMSNWKADSDISRLNRAEPGQWIDLPASLVEVLETALVVEQQSNGAFDIGVAHEVAAWGFGPDAGAPNTAAGTPRPVTRTHLEVDRLKLRARKHAPLRLDLSGIAKGYGVDRLGDALIACGVSDWLVGIDGEMRGKGRKPDGQAWAVGLERPIHGHRDIEGVVELTDLAIATSGTYRHCREVAGRTVSHTIDPTTGDPVTGSATSATVLAATCMEADAWATAVLVDGHWPPERFVAPAGIEVIANHLARPQRYGPSAHAL